MFNMKSIENKNLQKDLKNKNLISLRDASKFFKIPKQSILEKIENGSIKKHKVDTRILLDKDELENLYFLTNDIHNNKIISIANQKGGVGKTTTVINLSAALANRNRKVLVVDLDPQGNLSQTLLQNSDFEIEKTSYDIFNDTFNDKKELIYSIRDNLDIIPSDISLSKAESMINDFDKFYSLTDFLKSFSNNYDYTLIDTPPSLNIFTTSSFLASNYIVIPIQLNIFSLSGLNDLIHTINQIKKRNNNLEILGFIGCFYDKRNKLCENVLENVTQIGQTMFNTLINRNVKLEEQPAYETDIFEYDLNSIGSSDYNSFTDELIERIEK